MNYKTDNKKETGSKTKWFVVDARDIGWTLTKENKEGKKHKVTGIYLTTAHKEYVQVFSSSIIPTKKNHLKFNVAFNLDYDYNVLKYNHEKGKLEVLDKFNPEVDKAETLYSPE